MALSLFNPSTGAADTTPPPFQAQDAGERAAPYLGVYRCAGCGDEIAHDSLAVSCRCSEECYAATSATLPH